ncbi:MAG TPA: hypothetical protein VFW83_05430, partial [Bryobacteraceae bacterium]|nr:hypothetical protein [Bryobacteraceae bacterium]
DFYERCRPLLEQTVAATSRLASKADLDALYITGGGSELPLVARMLRGDFGRKVKRSEYTRSATAIGLAIQADATSGYTLREVFTRNFGVWRESEAGQRLIFDPIFPRGTRLPAAGEAPLGISRQYEPVHNIGYFRYLEASEVSESGQPAGDITMWDEILFPFDPALAQAAALEGLAVQRASADGGGRASSGVIEERYACDSAGGVTVVISNLSSDYSREYRLGRWSGKTEVIKPSARKRSKRSAG